MRLTRVKAVFFVLVMSILVCLGACKKYCYTCAQYCAYCVARNDSTIHLKACVNETQGEPEVDSIMAAWQQAGYECSKLDPSPANFCDNENGASNAINYYGAEDYYCYPQQ